MDETTANERFRDIAISRFEKFKSEVLSRRMVGFALCRAWVYLVFFNASLMLDKRNAHMALDAIYLFSLAALVVLLVGGGIAVRAFDRLTESPYGRAAPAILSILGTMAFPFANVNEVAGMAAIAWAALATGFGSGLFVLFWGKVYGNLGGSISTGEISVAYLLAALPVPLFLALPPLMQLAFVTVLPIGSAISLSQELDRQENESADQQCLPAVNDGGKHPHGDLEAETPREQENSSRLWTLEVVDLSWNMILAKLSIGSLVFGCVISLMRTTYSGIGAGTLNDGFNASLPYAALLACIVTLVPLLFSKKLDLAFSYKPVLILMTLGCILLPLVGTEHHTAHLITMAGYVCFEIMNWAILSDICFRFGMPICRVYGFGRAAASGGVLLGALIGSYLNSFVAYTPELLTAISFAMIFAMVITYTYTLTERDIAKITRQRSRHPYFPHEGTADFPRVMTVEDKVAVLAEQYDISGRGLEVLVLLAKGRTGTRIEQELYMSKGTVNTHMRRLYQKLGVHTRQELLDLVDEVASSEESSPTSV